MHFPRYNIRLFGDPTKREEGMVYLDHLVSDEAKAITEEQEDELWWAVLEYNSHIIGKQDHKFKVRSRPKVLQSVIHYTVIYKNSPIRFFYKLKKFFSLSLRTKAILAFYLKG